MGMLEDFARAVQEWGAKNVAAPLRDAAARVGKNWEIGFADPARRFGDNIEDFAQAIKDWGERNIADPARAGGNPFLTADGQNAIAAFWGDLLYEWTYADPTEAERVTAAAGTDVQEVRSTAEMIRLGGEDSTTAAARRDPRFGQVESAASEPEPVPSATPAPTGAGSASGAGGAGAGAGGAVPVDDTLPADGTPRQIPGGGELWNVDGTFYLAYTVPGTNTPLVWRVENPDRLKAIYGDAVPEPDRTLSQAEFKKLSPWLGGLSAELQNVDEDPWQVFNSKFQEAVELRPWLADPTMQAVIAVAYLEGRQPTTDELSQTDWWNEHTEDERAWLESSVTAGTKEVQRRKNDAVRATEDALKKAGMNNPPPAVVEFMAMQRLTGRWSEDYFAQQVIKLADPFASGELDKGVMAAMRGMGTAADAAAVSQGRGAVEQRVRAIFANRNVPIGSESETEKQRIDRIVGEVLGGKRTLADVRNSVDLLARKTEGGRPGGLDVTAQGEDRVKALATEWLGPVAGNLPASEVARWAGKIRNDPDAEQEFVEFLKDQRLALLPGYSNRDLSYNAIVSPVRNLATNIWGQHIDDESLLVDLANMGDYTQMSQKLRREGMNRGVQKVVQDALSGLTSTSLGDQVIRSAV